MSKNKLIEEPVSLGRIEREGGGMPDRASWGLGAWVNEDDKYEWRAYSFPCLIVRSPTGGLCGYVGVVEGHPWYCVNYDDVEADVHGGLTYSSRCGGHICHVPRAGESDEVWWLGFDCGHWGDLVPSLAALLRQRRSGLTNEGTYRDVAYVVAEVNRLAEQAAIASGVVGSRVFNDGGD